MAKKTALARLERSLDLLFPARRADAMGCDSDATAGVETPLREASTNLTRSRPEYSLQELLGSITDGNRHPAVDWGEPKGRELL